MKRVLVTGATGFVGRNTLRPLVGLGYEVHAMHSSSAPLDAEGVAWHHADLLDSAAVDDVMKRIQPSHLLHLAWYAEPGKYWTSEKNLDWVKATIDIARSFRDAGGERLVGAGTCAEYDWEGGILVERETPENPASLYGACKHAASTAVRAFCREGKISAAWGRIFFLYGPHEHPDRLVSSVIRSLLQDEPARCSSGLQRRDYLHVADVASALVAMLDSSTVGLVNVGSGVAPPVRDIVLKAGELIGKPDLIELGARPAKKGEPPLIQADVTRLTGEVGWRPTFDLDSGLRDTIAWWEEHASVAVGGRT